MAHWPPEISHGENNHIMENVTLESEPLSFYTPHTHTPRRTPHTTHTTHATHHTPHTQDPL
jgi:hypothetical protein